jgi:superfamily II DNA or RNA helicase
MRLVIRDEEWKVTKVENNSIDEKTLYCQGVSTLVRDSEGVFLVAVEEIEQVDPTKVEFILDESPFFRKSRIYIESLLRQKIPTDTDLHIAHRAAMDLMNYQLEPAKIALDNTRPRILIADTVGLGKTLEAGILMSELIARGKGKRILVVTLRSMMTQFQKELWNRFTIPLVRLDSKKITQLKHTLPANYNPFFYHDKTIVSIDTLKNNDYYRTHLEKSRWDIIVIDEAQNVAERGQKEAQRAKLARLLAKCSDTLILLSATPHDGRSKSFASLMNMLDPTAIYNSDNYGKNDIKGLCIRRFKKDIASEAKDAFLERNVAVMECQASPAEEAALGILAGLKLKMDAVAARSNNRLFKVALEKALFSSHKACLQTVGNRIKKLDPPKNDSQKSDLAELGRLKSTLEEIEPRDFSRYQKLVALLNDPAYGWTGKTDDRVVVFTERIETMRFLAAQLKKDLGFKDEAIQEIHGGMRDVEQQEIVDNFGRTESSVRLLVASDVASEGINLHYLCHRLIHFDIPWSLMLFQQRNGRIDRYGQPRRPDIRYLKILSKNERIGGDIRILDILVKKEEQAHKNIGDPGLLMGKYNIEEEEGVTAEAMESGTAPDVFEAFLDSRQAEFDPFEAMMRAAEPGASRQKTKDDTTLFSDVEFLETALPMLSRSGDDKVKRLESVHGVEITFSSELHKRLDALLPDEAIPEAGYLKLTTDKKFAMEEIKRSFQHSLSEKSWPKTQYLWKLHPLVKWINTQGSLLYGRNEAPIMGFPKGLSKSELMFVIAGSMPNRRSTPVVDEWFGLLFKNGRFSQALTMEDLVVKTKLIQDNLPNRQAVAPSSVVLAKSLLPKVVEEAKKVLAGHCEKYKKSVEHKISEEIDKLDTLEKHHVDFIKKNTEKERLRKEKLRDIDVLFGEFINFVHETMEIGESPYIKVVAAVTGVDD